LHLDFLEDRTLLTGHSLATASPIALNSSQTAALVGTQDVDFFKIQLTEDGQLTARVHAPAFQTRLSLLDESGQLVVESDGLTRANPDDLIIEHLAGQAAGMTYFLQVQGLGPSSGSYVLTTQLQPSTPPFEPIPTDNSQPPPATSIAEDPHNIIRGDFTGNGIADLAVANPASNDVSILLGLGDGTFQQVRDAEGNLVRPKVGKDPTALVAGDFNGDGIPDLAVVNSGEGTVSVLLGNGDGTFRTVDDANGNIVPPISVGKDPDAVVAADFDGDRHLDLAVANRLANTVSIFLGNGDGTFRKAGDLSVDKFPNALVAGDFNGDGITDLATVNAVTSNVSSGAPGDVSVFLGNGDGTFRPVTDARGSVVPVPRVGPNPTSMVVGDFTGDGKLDLAIADEGSLINNITLLIGQGDGTFRQVQNKSGPVSPTVQGRPLALSVGDFNGDGILDLVTANFISNDISVLLGMGDGTFQKEIKLSPDQAPSTLISGDFNGDGRLDLAVANNTSQDVTILPGVGDGSFQNLNRFGVGLNPGALIAADFNRDGRTDLATVSSNQVAVLQGTGDGTFQQALEVPAGADPTALATADFNGDGRTDLVVTSGVSENYSVLLGLGDGTFREFTGQNLAGSPIAVATADFNGDGRTDLAIASSRAIWVLFGNGDGTFQNPIAILTGSGFTTLAVGDLTGTGTPDLAVAGEDSTGAGSVAILLNRGDGTFRSVGRYAVGSGPFSLLAAQFSADGHLDLATADRFSNDVAVLLGNGDGTFQNAVHYAVGTHPTALVAANFHGANDQVLDLAVANQDSSSVSILLGNGNGTFQNQAQTPLAGTSPQGLVAGDFNGDGLTDLAVTNVAGADVSVLLGLGAGQFAQPNALASTNFQATPLLADLTGQSVKDSLLVDLSGRILLRPGQENQPTDFSSPIYINDPNGDPLARSARAVAILRAGTRNLIAAVDRNPDAAGLYHVRFYTVDPTGKARMVGTPLVTGSLPTLILAAQLQPTTNVAGFDDLVVLNAQSGTVSVFLAEAGGGYHALPPLTAGNGPEELAAANLANHPNGVEDILVANQVSGDVSILLNDGTGTAFTERRFHAGQGPYLSAGTSSAVTSPERTSGLVVGDYTGDGIPDIVLTNAGSNSFSLLLGLGGGSFLNPVLFILPFRPSIVAAGRFLGENGSLDLAFLNQESQTIAIFLGESPSGFREQFNQNAGMVTPLLTGTAPSGLAVNDVNGDGILDLQVANVFGDLLTLLGNGDGTFRIPTGVNQVSVAAQSISTQVPALVVSSEASNQVQTGNDPKHITSPLPPPAGGFNAPGAASYADLNGDHIPDLVVPDGGGNRVLVYLGLAQGGFADPLSFSVGTDPVSVKVAALNDDLVADPTTGRLIDPTPDLVVVNRGSNDVSILYGQGQLQNWTLVPGPRPRAGAAPTSAIVQDINGDGKPDILVSNSQSNNVSRILGVGNGFFNDNTNPPPLPVGIDPVLIVPVITPRGLGFGTVDSGSNDLTLVSSPAAVSPDVATIPVEPDPTTAVVFGQHGLSDFIVASGATGQAELLLSQADGSFSSLLQPSGFRDPTGIALAAAPTPEDNTVTVFLAGDANASEVVPVTFELVSSQGPIVPGPEQPPSQPQVPVLLPLKESTLAIVAVVLTGVSDTDLTGNTSTETISLGGGGRTVLDSEGSVAVTSLVLAGGDDVSSLAGEGAASSPAQRLAAVLGWLADAAGEFLPELLLPQQDTTQPSPQALPPEGPPPLIVPGSEEAAPPDALLNGANLGAVPCLTHEQAIRPAGWYAVAAEPDRSPRECAEPPYAAKPQGEAGRASILGGGPRADAVDCGLEHRNLQGGRAMDNESRSRRHQLEPAAREVGLRTSNMGATALSLSFCAWAIGHLLREHTSERVAPFRSSAARVGQPPQSSEARKTA
jgi:hypothetical protein